MTKLLKVLGIIALLGVVITFGCCAACSNEVGKQVEEIDKKANSEVDLKVGETKKVNNEIEVTFKEFKDNYKVQLPTKGMKYVLVKLNIKNISKKSISLVGTFDAFADGKHVEEYYMSNVKDISGTIIPDTSLEGGMVFEVPKKAKSYKIVYDYGVLDGKINLVVKK